MPSDALLKDLGNNLYKISAPAAFYILFQVDEHLPIDTVAGAGQEIASCSTECQSLSLSVDFTCKIVQINQPFIDYLKATEGRNFEDKFSQADWILIVEKVSSEELTNPFFNKGYHACNGEKYIFEAFPWTRLVNAYTLELGYFSAYLPLEYYVRNFQILGEAFKKGEKVCSFDYYPKYRLLDEQEKWQLAEKHKSTAYLYAPYDIKNVSFNEMLLLQAQYHPQPNGWILMNIKEDFILRVEKIVNFYTDYWCWYQYENDLIRIGLDVEGDEYIQAHKPWYPMEYASAGKIFIAENRIAQHQEICYIGVDGPMDKSLYPEFDMEIVAVNPKVFGDGKLGQPCEILETDPYGEGWLFLVKPLDAEKTAKMFEEWRDKGYFR